MKLRTILVCILAATACEKASSHSSSSSTPTASVDTTVAPGQVKLIDAGKDPKRVMAYKFAVGTKEGVSLQMSSDLEIEAEGQKQHVPVPGQTVSQEMTIASVNADGSAQLEGEITKVEAANAPGFDPKMIEGTKVHMTFSPQGKISNMGAEGGNPLVDQLMSQMGNQLANPLPTEPIGVGARWKYHMQTEMMQLKVDVYADYELKSVDGDHLVIAAKVTTPSIDAGKMAAAMGGADAKMEISGGGEGEMQIDLTKPMPTTKMKMDMSLKGRVQGKSISGHMKMNMQMQTS